VKGPVPETTVTDAVPLQPEQEVEGVETPESTREVTVTVIVLVTVACVPLQLVDVSLKVYTVVVVGQTTVEAVAERSVAPWYHPIV
jgi:hypothetical protein